MARTLDARPASASASNWHDSQPRVAVAGRQRPNFLLLLADDMGYADWPGLSGVSLPHLDALASGGTRFTHFYSASSICSPSRGALLTGRLPVRWGGAGGNWKGTTFGAEAVGGLPPSEVTLAATLRAHGYATACVGKWHLGQRRMYSPVRHGFDYFLGLPFSADMGSTAWEFAKGMASLPLVRGDGRIIEQPTRLDELTARLVDFGASFVRNASAARRPWLLYVPFHQPHVPQAPAPRWCNSSARGRYGDALQEMDAAVGALMEAAEGAHGSTLTLFLSDNGPWLDMAAAGGSAHPLRGGKFTTWEGGIRVPAVAHWPGVVPASRVVADVALTLDVLPTLLSLAGAPLPEGVLLDGVDLSAMLRGNGTADADRCSFFYGGTPGAGCAGHGHKGEGGRRNASVSASAIAACPGLWAVRCGAFKGHWVTRNGQRVQPKVQRLLFDVVNDPAEAHALGSTSPQAARAWQTIDAAVARHRATLPGAPGVAHVPNQVAKGQDPRFRACCTSNMTEAAGRRLGQQQHRHHPAGYPPCTCTPSHYHVAHVCEPVVPPCPAGARKIDACNIRRGRVVPDALRQSFFNRLHTAQPKAQPRSAPPPAPARDQPSPPPPPWYTVAKAKPKQTASYAF